MWGGRGGRKGGRGVLLGGGALVIVMKVVEK